MKYVKGLYNLREMGLSWFVMYKYYEEIDPLYINWKHCNSYELRKSYYEEGRENHASWLEYVLFDSNENLLDNNQFGVTGAEIKKLASDLYLLGDRKFQKKSIVPKDIIIKTKCWEDEE